MLITFSERSIHNKRSSVILLWRMSVATEAIVFRSLKFWHSQEERRPWNRSQFYARYAHGVAGARSVPVVRV